MDDDKEESRISEPGIRRGNEDCRGNAKRKSPKIYLYIFCGEKIDKHTCFSMKIKTMDL